MATQHALTEFAERDFASVELDELALAHAGRPWATWRQAVLDWHLRTLAAARSEAWIPGLADSRDPIVEKMLERLFSHYMAAAVKRLRAENLELRRRMLGLAECTSGDGGPVARGRQHESA
jgi:hypothetical protein